MVIILPHRARRKTVGTFLEKVHCFCRKVGDFRGKRGDYEKALFEGKRGGAMRFSTFGKCAPKATPRHGQMYTGCVRPTPYIIEQRRSDTEAVVQPLKKEPSPLGKREGLKKNENKKTKTTGFQHGRGRCAAKPTTQAHALAEGRGAKRRGEGKIVGMPLPDTEKTSETQGVWREKRKFAS